MDSKIHSMRFVDQTPEKAEEDILLLKKLRVDTVGTTSGAVWVKVFGTENFDRTALYKPMDYEEPYGAQAELISSHFNHLCLRGIKVRVPEINLVGEKGDIGILSYRVHDRMAEDFIHIDELLHYRFSEDEIRQLYTLGLKDILSCIEHEVNNEANFKEIEKAVVMVACSDAFTNNADRHGKNWALVRNKESNYYELAIYDNVKSFINILFNRPGYKDKDLWSIGYVGLNSSKNISTGAKIIEAVKKEYPEYFEEFLERFNLMRDVFVKDIESVPGIDSKRIEKFFSKKAREFSKEQELDWQ